MAGVRIGGSAALGLTSPPFTVGETGLGYALWRIYNSIRLRVTPTPVPGTGTDEIMTNARLSADNTMIAFAWNWPKPDTSGAIAVVNATGGTPLYITPDDAGVGLFEYPSWHPDGTKVVYVYCPDAIITNGGRIEAVDITGSGTPDVLWTPDVQTPQREGGFRPQYSPDGTQIAFIVNVDDGGGGDYTRQGLWVMDADGSSPTLIDAFDTTQGNGGYGFSGTQLAWGNLGNLVYSSGGFADSTREIYAINADGSGKTQLSNGSAAGNLGRIGHGSWNDADDGVFASIFDSGTGTFPWALSADGGTQTQLVAVNGMVGGQNFANCYRIPGSDRLWYITDLNPPLVATIKTDGTDYQTFNMTGPTTEFLDGEGFESS
jgi:Tol biopolymer transport system component